MESKNVFGFKELKVWQKAMDFANEVINTTEMLNASNQQNRLVEQLVTSVVSIPQQISKGKGQNSKEEFLQHLYQSRGSLHESITMINILSKRDWITAETLSMLEKYAVEISGMLKGLIKSVKEPKK
jgi:four helix bundle protein